MSRPWMPMFWGDYFADTRHLTTVQHGAYLLMIGHCWQTGTLPDGDEARAAVAGLTVAKWREMKPVIERFFQADGTHKRIASEVEKTERKIMQRRIAGQRGGHKSGITRAIQAHERREANEAKPNQIRSKDETQSNQNRTKTEAAAKLSRTNHQESINLSSESETPRATEAVDIGKQSQSASERATALPTGAPARSPISETGNNIKPPSAYSRAELDAILAKKRASNPVPEDVES